MRVYDISPSDKGPLAFEVNAWIGRRQAARVADRIHGVRMLRRPRLFGREEVFCEFVVKDQLFNIWEPYGDNGRYWIGPSSGKRTLVLLQVRQVFIDYTIPRFRTFANWMRQGKGTT